MRINFLVLVWLFAANAVAQALLLHNLWLGGGSLALAVALFFVHRRRVRQFKAYDESRKFD